MDESIKCFALITSKVVEFYHKTAEYILVEKRDGKPAQRTLDNAESIYRITRICLRSVTILADDFCKKCRVSIHWIYVKKCYQNYPKTNECSL